MNDEKGIIYLMTTAVEGLIKIGKTMTSQYKNRIRFLEKHGYCNVTGLKIQFAIEVNKYSDKEQLLHSIFQKSQIGNTELFALDINTAMKLLSSFDGKLIFSAYGDKETTFNNATENIASRLIPNGIYYFKKQKKSDNKVVEAKAKIENGIWYILKGSILGETEDKGVSAKAKLMRENMKIGEKGVLLEDIELGECTPSFAGVLIMNSSINGWSDWYDEKGNKLDKYRKESQDD
ncbi:GIY-YIG nuclease family protein [uncultured Brachyspira sp.]|uniref:GIY-YIG nuclease family protein n=1 Tax=uncultured Brachyspira sp. TaxID=221953 RepID=UPI00345C3F83